MLRSSLLAISLLALASKANAEPLNVLLQELVTSHPRIVAGQESVKSSEASLKEATSGYFPKVDLLAARGYEENDRTKLSTPAPETDLNTTNVGLTVTQNLFEGFRTVAATESATTGIDLSETTLTSTRQEVMFEGISAYLDVLRQVKLTELALQNQDTLKRQLNLEDERVERGSGIAVDVLQAKSRLQISKERYTAFLGGLKDATSRFAQVFGQAPSIDSMSLPQIPLTTIPDSLDGAVQIAVEKNPTLLSSSYTRDIAGINRTSARSGYFPVVDVVGASTYDDNVGGIRGEETNNSIQLRMTWNLFSGFADQARVERSAYDYQNAIETHQFTERKVIEEVKLAWSAMKTSQERSNLLDNAVNIAGEVFDARKRLRDAGSDTALNVLDAENELFRARIDATAARFDYYSSVYRLLSAMGVLTLENAT